MTPNCASCCGQATRPGIDGRLLGGSAASTLLAEILRIGVLVQLLTRNEEIDVNEAARRLGIERAA